MVFNHRVKCNGILYEAGQNVPIEDTNTENDKNKKIQNEVKTEKIDGERNAQKLVTSDSYTKTEINRMSILDLKKLAKKQGIKGTEEMTGAELKKVLIEKFGL